MVARGEQKGDAKLGKAAFGRLLGDIEIQPQRLQRVGRTGARGCGAVAVLRHRYSGGGNNQRHGCRDVQAMAAVAARTANVDRIGRSLRSEEHTSELQSLMRISYAVFCLKK